MPAQCSPEKNKSWFERHPVLTLTFTSCLGIILLLALAEGIARLFIPQWAPMTAERALFWQYDSLLGWQHIPNKTGQFTHPDFSVEVSINSQGLRGPEFSLIPDTQQRMLILGDSYGWGFGVEEPAIFSSLIESKHPGWEIINASVSGYSTVQQYLFLVERGLSYQPDAILLMFYGNDFEDNIGLNSYWYNKPIVQRSSSTKTPYSLSEGPVPPPSVQQKFERYLLGNFYIARGLYPVLGLPFALADHYTNKGSENNAENLNLSEQDKLPATIYILDKLAKTINAHNPDTPLIIVSAPLSAEKYHAIDSVCTQHNLLCLNLRTTFKQHKNSNWHFPNDRHWNETGHKIVADAIEEFLQGKVF